MAVLGYQINPNLGTSLKSELAQGANVGDRAYGTDNNYYYWTGDMWENRNAEVGLSGGGGSTSAYPTFNFDWNQARQDALTQLTPYYEQKLKEAGGDVERAKRLIEEDYSRGVRYSKEDLTRTTTQGEEDAATAMKSLGLDITDETRNTQGQLNNRGVLLGTIPQGSTSAAAPVSDYAKTWTLGPMEERQNLRKLAIERALQRQKEAATTTSTRETEQLGTARARGIEEQNIQYPRTQLTLEEEKRRRAFENVAPMAYNEAYAKYRAVNNLG